MQKTITFIQFINFINGTLLPAHDKVYFIRKVYQDGLTPSLKQELTAKLSALQEQLTKELRFLEQDLETRVE